jgi:hypothetical protein
MLLAGLLAVASAVAVSAQTAASPASEGYQPPHITVANPTPVEPPWPMHEKIAWAANLVLAIVAYAGVMMAISLLKKIERQTGYAEAAAESAHATAQAALLNAQAVIHAERPWILVTVETSRSAENSFVIMATNRGRTPATILETFEQIRVAVDEGHLPGAPEYSQKPPKAAAPPVILLPGESTPIQPFSRNDVRGLCDSEERFKRIETWEEKVFLYGKIVYKDLISPSSDQAHETDWCCWYVHGRQNSGLVIAGPADYNSHS